jgi:hypothetical protein
MHLLAESVQTRLYKCHVTCCLPALLQTKGVKGVATIDINTAAWIAAVASVGCAILGSALLWPVMKSNLKK